MRERLVLGLPVARRCCCDSILMNVLYSAISLDDNGPSMT